jgi:REP element-mobilizing transposase RayT
MRRARITYEGAFHHAMNRGINGDAIFAGSKSKAMFLDVMQGTASNLKIKILTYCIMDNHYHLILENSSGRMSDFFRQLNGNYGMIYRKLYGEHGYVFQGRYKSTLIQADAYLRLSIRYALLNPVRAGIVTEFDSYIWSSANEYFSEISSGIVDSQFVNELFSSKQDFLGFMELNPTEELLPRQTKYGEILGDSEFEKSAFEKFDRRDKKLSIGWKRSDDQEPIFNPVEKVIWEFEQKIGMPIEELDITTHEGKRLRGELLIHLKETAGLKYIEIIEIPPFDNLKLPSLGKLYRDAKVRMLNKRTNLKKE